MADSKTHILLTGATGFVGGSVLSTLLTSPDDSVQKCKYSVMVRGADKAAYFESKGITPILFQDLEEADILRAAAAQNDIVINCATGFATTAARALIEGLGIRRRDTGRKVHFIHLSGTSNFGDFPITRRYIEPRYADGGAFVDTDDIFAYFQRRDALEAYPQRTTDLTIVETGAANAVPTTCFLPPTIWGKGSGGFARRSMQIPSLCREALKARQPLVLGEGVGRIDQVNVLDLAMLFELVLRAVLRGDKVASGKDGFYFCENGQLTWLELAQAIGNAGKELGYLDSAEVKHLDLETGKKTLAGSVLGPDHVELGFSQNAVTQTSKVRAFDWEPRFTLDDFFKSVRDELEVAHGDHD